MFVRSYAYIRSLGAAGLRDVSEMAVLNANYLLARLRARACSSICRSPMTGSACTSSSSPGAPMKRDLEIRTLDLAKRLLDHGVHPPTVYFPLLVDEALLIEPTETETKETLDALRRRSWPRSCARRRGSRDRAQRAAHHAGAAS